MTHRGNVTKLLEKVWEQLTLHAVPRLVPRCIHEAALFNNTGREAGWVGQARSQQQSLPQV